MNKCLVILMSLLAVTVANAAPTVSNFCANCDTPTVSNCGCNPVASAVSPCSDTHIPVETDVAYSIESGNSRLAGVTAEFLKPPAAFTGSPAPPMGAKSLPAVPGALLMGLTGFLCVSLVKDRKFWLAALAGLLWLGQTGIQAVPHLAMHLSHRNHTGKQLDTLLTYPYHLENSGRMRSDIEGTKYIGLLHHLAGMPDRAIPFLFSKEYSPTKDQIRTPQFTIIGLSSKIITENSCLAAKVEQFVYFSPAFIFENLARGPPKPA
ncbi:MAG: hypothetical protein FVQ85_14655 [Planctomycetes bacterium]|nr:hypothetical protein [Planctomycetota bacterium]